MADYTATSRSNYFPFLPSKLVILQQIFGPQDIKVVHRDGLISIISSRGTAPEIIYEGEGDFTPELKALGCLNAEGIDDISLLDVIHHLLPLDASLVWIEVGHEKARYLVGQALRIDHTGVVTKTVNLNDIYEEGDTRAEH